jgi:cell cycle sensor histidine kinase DivJ
MDSVQNFSESVPLRMPNRTDHTVKMSRKDRDPAINAYVLAAGSLFALIGALAAALMGETLGIWLGAATLTTLIFVQFFSTRQMRQRDNSPHVSDPDKKVTDRVADLFRDEPVLLISTSRQGRVRAMTGQQAFCPGLKVGSVLVEVLGEEAVQSGTLISESQGPLSLKRIPSEHGEIILLIPARPDGQAVVDDELLQRTSFFAGLGHDLKSPLNGIIGFADIMDAELRGPMPEAYQDYPALIREGGETLLRLVEDMLGYAKAEAGTYELDPAPMDIAASGESVLRQSQAVADLAGVRLRFKPARETLALADASAVGRIWDNLVSNAIKYSSNGDTVTLSAFEKNSACYLQVRDTGAGMDQEDLARIAKPFAQGRNAKGRAGTGLGLAMVQRLAEMHGGQVKIETAPGQGTCVTVRLPAVAGELKRAAE